MSLKEQVHEIIDAEESLIDAANVIYSGPQTVAVYCIQLGLEFLKSRRRATKRRELRAVIQPEFTPAPSGITGRVVLTQRAKKRIVDNARELFAGWMINASISLGEATKEDLMKQAGAERASAKGNIRNAQLYEALAEPLKDGQRATSYWTPKKVQEVKEKIWSQTEDQVPTLT